MTYPCYHRMGVNDRGAEGLGSLSGLELHHTASMGGRRAGASGFGEQRMKAAEPLGDSEPPEAPEPVCRDGGRSWLRSAEMGGGEMD